MKLVYTLFLTLLVLTALGQRPQPSSKAVLLPPQPVEGQHNKQETLDTLSPGNELNATEYIQFWYGEDEGFVFGTNVYGDDAFGQRFVVTEPYTIYQAIFWIAETAGDTGNVVFTVWDFDEETGPGQVLATDTIALADITGSVMFEGAPVVTFDPPLEVYNDYVIGVDMSGLGDYAWTGTGTGYAMTYGLVHVSTGEGDGGQLGHAWIRNPESGWMNALDDFQYDVDIAIYPLVSDATTSSEDLIAAKGSFHFYPNPARGQLHVEGTQPIRQIRILDLTGRQVLQQAVEGYQTEVALHDFRPGIYILQIEGAHGIRTHKFHVMK